MIMIITIIMIIVVALLNHYFISREKDRRVETGGSTKGRNKEKIQRD